jgi:hypothetical protein
MILQNILNKFLGSYIHTRYRNIPYNLRFFIRDTYNCQIRQSKYFFSDYLSKKPYKEISFDGEFGPELQFVLPFAYWHFKNGTLKKTRSSKNTAEFYFFSPDHQEVFDIRTNDGNYNYEIPRILYSHNYNIEKWLPVPLKQQYRNNTFVFDKPILIVANRFNKEWDKPPISFFSIEMLAYIFDKFKNDYTIIYNRPGAQHITMDNSDIYELNEFEWMKTNFPEVLLMSNLYKQHKANVNNYNHLQLLVYANAENFLSTHGGTSVLASYFGGRNIVLSKEGPQVYFKCFEKIYPKLSGAEVFHAKTDEEFKQLVDQVYFPETNKVAQTA